MFAVRLRPGRPRAGRRCRRRGAVAAMVGLTRVYLRVHYLSDVTGGWAVGVSVFTVCGAVAVLAAHLRQNEHARWRACRIAPEYFSSAAPGWSACSRSPR